MVQMKWSGDPPKSPEACKVTVEDGTAVKVEVTHPEPVKVVVPPEKEKNDR
jgi:hypothetical protein